MRRRRFMSALAADIAGGKRLALIKEALPNTGLYFGIGHAKRCDDLGRLSYGLSLYARLLSWNWRERCAMRPATCLPTSRLIVRNAQDCVRGLSRRRGMPTPTFPDDRGSCVSS